MFPILALVGAMCAGCYRSPPEDLPVVVNLKVGIGQVGTPAKISVITLKGLEIVFTSSVGDTLRDTITANSSPVRINPLSSNPQTIKKQYLLTPLRSWKITAVTRGLKDSIIHEDSVKTAVLHSGDSVAISLSLDARYSMYKAKFLSLPDSITSLVSGTARQILILNRLVFKLDGIIVVDSTRAGGFTPLTNVALPYDYVTPGSHGITLEAWGRIKASSPDSLLYTGTRTIYVDASSDSTVAFVLGWVGPTTGTGSISATIGKVGKLTVNGVLPGSPIQ